MVGEGVCLRLHELCLSFQKCDSLLFEVIVKLLPTDLLTVVLIFLLMTHFNIINGRIKKGGIYPKKAILTKKVDTILSYSFLINLR